MDSEMRESKTQPQRIVTETPFVRLMKNVVESPKGTAIMATDLADAVSPNYPRRSSSPVNFAHNPKMLIMLRDRGNSLL